MPVLFDTQSRVNRSAEISPCGNYRWWLRRSWSLWSAAGEHVIGKGVCTFVMLNPSTADATDDDATIRRCISFARGWGYDILTVRNLFPWRSTDPSALKTAVNVTGGHRGDQELLAAMTGELVVAAWGVGVLFNRDHDAMRMFRNFAPEKQIYCLGVTKHGHPRHPLYVRSDTKPVLFTPNVP